MTYKILQKISTQKTGLLSVLKLARSITARHSKSNFNLLCHTIIANKICIFNPKMSKISDIHLQKDLDKAKNIC